MIKRNSFVVPFVFPPFHLLYFTHSIIAKFNLFFKISNVLNCFINIVRIYFVFKGSLFYSLVGNIIYYLVIS